MSQGLCPTAAEKLAAIHNDLHDWDRKILKAPRARLKKAQRELERLMNVPFTTEVSVKQKEMSVLIENLLEQDEIYWSQRGRVNWL